MLGENIYNLRKKKKLSQEQLSVILSVSRQTISNWELGETSPNPEQLKMLSKTLNVSIDELVGNDIKNIIEEKVSNTEKLAGLIIKILKIVGIGLVIFIVIDIISFIVFAVAKPQVESSAATICTINDKTYQIEFGTNKYFQCDNCDDKMNNEIKSIVDFDNIEQSMNNIESYFEKNNGTCE
jgi:transcriptional regulator with XRE-family HTH domain